MNDDTFFWYEHGWRFGDPDGNNFSAGETFDECLKNWLTGTSESVPSTESTKGDTDAEEEKVVKFAAR
jgi:hypothetical protein